MYTTSFNQGDFLDEKEQQLGSPYNYGDPLQNCLREAEINL